jgi:peptidyl-prolyl cis-trans isomerase-like 4
MAVVIETTLGDITVDLFTEERPRSKLSLLNLTRPHCMLFALQATCFHEVVQLPSRTAK